MLIGIHAVTSALKTAAADVEWLRVLADSHNKRLLEVDAMARKAGVEITRIISAPVCALPRLPACSWW